MTNWCNHFIPSCIYLHWTVLQISKCIANRKYSARELQNIALHIYANAPYCLTFVPKIWTILSACIYHLYCKCIHVLKGLFANAFLLDIGSENTYHLVSCIANMQYKYREIRLCKTSAMQIFTYNRQVALHTLTSQNVLFSYIMYTMLYTIPNLFYQIYTIQPLSGE